MNQVPLENFFKKTPTPIKTKSKVIFEDVSESTYKQQEMAALSMSSLIPTTTTNTNPIAIEDSDMLENDTNKREVVEKLVEMDDKEMNEP